MKIAKAVLAAGAVIALLAAPSAASATTGWVAQTPPTPPFNSCAHPGYERIQDAINGPVTVVKVCPGVYQEQLQITHAVNIGPGASGYTVKLPAAPAASTTAWASVTRSPTETSHFATSASARPSPMSGRRNSNLATRVLATRV